MLPSVLADPERRRLYSLLVLTGLVQSVSLVLLISLARDFLSQPEPAITVTAFSIGLGGIAVLALGRFSERYFAEKLAQQYITGLRQKLFNHALHLGGAGRKTLNRGGSLLRLTGDMSAIRNWIVQGTAPLLVLGTWLAVSLTALVLLNPLLLLSLMPVMIGAVAGNYLLGRRLYRSSETTRRRKTQLIRNATEKLRTVELVQAFNQQAREGRRFQRQGDRLYLAQLDRARLSGILRAFNEVMLGLALLLLLFTGLYLIRSGALTLADLSLLLGAALYLLGHLRRLGRLYEFWTLKQVAVHKLQRFFAQKTLRHRHRGRSPGQGFTLQLEAFACAGRFAPVTGMISERDRIRVEGDSGCGKSSLLMALAGLVQPSSGEMRLNHCSTASLSHRLLARRIALVSPLLPLLRGTLKKNLFYAARGENREYSEEVLQLCGLSGWIQEQSKGLQTPVDEAGENLSSTVQFRLLLARALLRRPSMLMIDQHEALLDENIQRLLIRLWQWFPGVLLVVNAPALLQQSGQVWQMTPDRVRVIRPAGQKENSGKRMQDDAR